MWGADSWSFLLWRLWWCHSSLDVLNQSSAVRLDTIKKIRSASNGQSIQNRWRQKFGSAAWSWAFQEPLSWLSNFHLHPQYWPGLGLPFATLGLLFLVCGGYSIVGCWCRCPGSRGPCSLCSVCWWSSRCSNHLTMLSHGDHARGQRWWAWQTLAFPVASSSLWLSQMLMRLTNVIHS